MKNKFNYMLTAAAQQELKKCGIKFIEVDIGDEENTYPGLELPSGKVLFVAQDDECNGPGSIQEGQ